MLIRSAAALATMRPVLLLRVKERTLVCIKIPRSDTNERGEYQVTVTSELHAQAERTNKQERLHPLEAKTKTQTQRMVLTVSTGA